MINVICLKWGNKYDAEYVNKLYRGVCRNLALPFEFTCFTENSIGIDPYIKIEPLPFNRITSWWQKLYLFSPHVPLSGRVFYIDLDTLITGNIDDIASVDTGFVVLRDFFFRVAQGVNTHSMGSGLMSWDVGKHQQIWNNFIDAPAKHASQLHPHGDQRWIQKQELNRVYWQDLFPEQIVSFKCFLLYGDDLASTGKERLRMAFRDFRVPRDYPVAR